VRKLTNSASLAIIAAALWSLHLDAGSSFAPTLAPAAQALIGRPVTPVSYAGVARRTTRRVVYAESAAVSAATAQQQQQAAAAPPPAPAPAPAQLPAGTVVTALPAGCTSTVVDGVNLFNCGGVMYQPTFQSNNLVYVVR
jgi:hypothetical protein